MSDLLKQFREDMLAELIRNRNINPSNNPVPPISPIDQYQKPLLPVEAYTGEQTSRPLIGGGMLGYQFGNENGMFSGKGNLDNLRLNYYNKLNDVNVQADGKGNASINWNGKF